MNKNIILIIAIIIFVTPIVAKADLDCDRLDPSQELSSNIETDIEGSAKALLKIGKFEGKFGNKIDKEVKNLYFNYPNADKLVIKSKLIYLFCILLDNSPDIESRNKFKMFEEFSKNVLQVGKEEVENPPDKVKTQEHVWSDGTLEVTVESLKKVGKSVVIKILYKNISIDTISVGFQFGNAFLIDEDGYKWKYRSDTVKMGYKSATLNRDEEIRTRITFDAEESNEGTVFNLNMGSQYPHRYTLRLYNLTITF